LLTWSKADCTNEASMKFSLGPNSWT